MRKAILGIAAAAFVGGFGADAHNDTSFGGLPAVRGGRADEQGRQEFQGREPLRAAEGEEDGQEVEKGEEEEGLSRLALVTDRKRGKAHAMDPEIRRPRGLLFVWVGSEHNAMV